MKKYSTPLLSLDLGSRLLMQQLRFHSSMILQEHCTGHNHFLKFCRKSYWGPGNMSNRDLILRFMYFHFISFLFFNSKKYSNMWNIEWRNSHKTPSMHILCLFVDLLHPINVKTAKPIWPEFFVGPHMTQRILLFMGG